MKVDIPWSNISNGYSFLTWGMLSNDFIGFHTKEYCDNYLEALQEWFPVEIKIAGKFYEIIHQDSVTAIGAFPIGLDVDRILSEVSEGKTVHYNLGVESLHDRLTADRKRKRHIFGGLEQCDYTKGLTERLAIFSHALNKMKSMNRDARFCQITAPNRSDNPEYKYLDAVLREEVVRINSRFPGEPVIHVDEGQGCRRENCGGDRT